MLASTGRAVPFRSMAVTSRTSRSNPSGCESIASKSRSRRSHTFNAIMVATIEE